MPILFKDPINPTNISDIIDQKYQDRYHDYTITGERDDFYLIEKDSDLVIIHSGKPIAGITVQDGRVIRKYVMPMYRNLGLMVDLYLAAIKSGPVNTRYDRDLDSSLSRIPDITIVRGDTNMTVSRKLMESETFDRDRREFRQELFKHSDPNIYNNPEWQPEISKWPLDPAELREVEKQIFQQPSWLAYYARFDWTSWQNNPSHWYNKNNGLFSFYDVPCISYYNEIATPDRNLIQLDRDGNIVENTKFDKITVLPTALHQCQRVVEKAREKMKWLNGRYYIRFGLWPKSERSQNFLIRDRVVLEKGVSAYHVDYDLDEDRWAIDPSVNPDTIAGTMQSLIYSNRPIFLVKGDEIEEEGSDGEPLLHNVVMIKQLPKGDVYCPGIFDPREDED